MIIHHSPISDKNSNKEEISDLTWCLSSPVRLSLSNGSCREPEYWSFWVSSEFGKGGQF